MFCRPWTDTGVSVVVKVVNRIQVLLLLWWSTDYRSYCCRGDDRQMSKRHYPCRGKCMKRKRVQMGNFNHKNVEPNSSAAQQFDRHFGRREVQGCERQKLETHCMNMFQREEMLAWSLTSSGNKDSVWVVAMENGTHTNLLSGNSGRFFTSHEIIPVWIKHSITSAQGHSLGFVTDGPFGSSLSALTWLW